MIVINYDSLVRNYWDNLNDKLRGFSSSDKFEFLETWVPDENHVDSVSEIIHCATDYDVLPITIRISKTTFEKIDTEKIRKQFDLKISYSIDDFVNILIEEVI